MPPTTASSPPHAQTPSSEHGAEPAQVHPTAAAEQQPVHVQTPAQALWRMREYMRPYYFALFLMISAAILAVSSEIAIPLITKSVIDSVVVQGIRSKLIPLAVAAMALGTIQAGLNFFRRWSVSGAVIGMEKTVRDDLYHHLQQLEPAFHDSWQSGQLLSRATNDLATIRRFAGFGVVFLITNTWTFLLIVALLIRLNWWLGLLTGLLFLPVVVLCLRFEKKYRVLSRLNQDQQGDLATYVEEAATGIRVLKSLGRRDEAAARHLAQARLVYRSQVDKASLRGTFWAGLDMVPNAVIGLLLLLGALAVSRHELSLGGLVAFVTLTLLLVWPIESLGFIIATGQEAATAAQRIYEIFDTVPAIRDPASHELGATGDRPGLSAGRWQSGKKAAMARTALKAQADSGAAAAAAARRASRPRPAGLLIFDEVAFSYPQANSPVLRGVSLELQPGETVALVGATGSGKTTLLHLVPRLADVTGGQITLDGTDIRDLPLPELRSRVGCAFEDPILFSASVRENVGFGVPDAREDDILAALDAAQAEFVADLPWGLDTRIGEQGMALSGGQRQRVALARAILSKPQVLLLDDPLSALDVHTEARVTAALAEVLTSTTALIVAHRPSTVQLADRVALLQGGVITAIGRHSELLATEPRYRYLMSADTTAATTTGETGDDGHAAPGLTAGATR
ncbi:MAG TPA: ABC transporter ATP-binding protein [Streptosporangiaceae bacterium]|nr:ABC transporter ATP-binding protein [Streptosporangiaceae bacterium]